MKSDRHESGAPRMARAFIRLFFSDAESAEILADLGELGADRRGLARAVWFWTRLLGYPLRAGVERLRGPVARAASPRRGGLRLDAAWRDARHALRSLARSPGFTATAALILGLGSGAATAMYSVVKGVLLEPLPVEAPDRLMFTWLLGDDGVRGRMTPGNVRDVEGLDVFRSVAGFQGSAASLRLDGAAISLRGGAVTPGYFETLGVPPLLGRTFRQEEGELDGEPVMILGHHLWVQTFGADPGVLGRRLDLDGASITVVGVMASGVFPTSVSVGTEIPFTTASQDYFVPLRFTAELWDLRRPHIMGAVARLEDGVTREAASEALATLSARLRATGPYNQAESLILNPFTDEVVGDARLPLLAIFAALGLVMVVALVNVGALFVLRLADREPELALRVALGAGQLALARRLLFEGLAVVGAAALLGALVAAQAISWMQRLVPYQIPRFGDVRLDLGALAATTGLSAALALLFGLAPARRALSARTAGGVGGTGAGVRRGPLHGGVIAVQAALSVVVMVGAALLARSFGALASVDPGFSELDTWVVRVQGEADLDALVERVRGTPGVAAAARTYDHPLERNWSDGFRIRGRPDTSSSDAPAGTLRPFGEGYFETVGIARVEGRLPDRADFSSGARYAVVNEALRDRYFPTGGAVGAVIDVPTAERMFGEGAGSYEIVGVVENVRFMGPDQPREPAFYLPLSTFPTDANTLLIRPELPDAGSIGAVLGVLRAENPGLALGSAQRLADVRDALLARPRFNATLLACFAAMGLALCALGSYALARRVVASRAREMGVRMALGADGRRLMASVTARVLGPMVIGALAGSAAAVALTGGLRSLLFEISPHDPVSLLAAPAVILLAGGMAAALPARQVLNADPARTLRAD